VRSLDDMLAHLDAWDRTADRRRVQRRVAAHNARNVERRAEAERRAEVEDTLARRRASDAVVEATHAKANPPFVASETPVAVPIVTKADAPADAADGQPPARKRRQRNAAPGKPRVRKRSAEDDGPQTL
jgi:hypothetical protein